MQWYDMEIKQINIHYISVCIVKSELYNHGKGTQNKHAKKMRRTMIETISAEKKKTQKMSSN